MPRVMSLSGRGRNRTFLSRGGLQFADATGLSGLDAPGDSRAFVVFDYNRDGWSDIAVINANAPKLQLFANRIGDIVESNVIALALTGVSSNPDAIGARVTVTTSDGRRLLRELYAGGGLAAQSSKTLLVGLGSATATGVEVRWPGGDITRVGAVPSGSLLRLREGEAMQVEPYLRSLPERTATGPRLSLAPAPASQLAVYTTVATWCDACKRDLPAIRRLRDAFTADEVALYGAPLDPDDSEERLRRYSADHGPAYELLAELPQAQRKELEQHVETTTGALPTSIITTRDGRILATHVGAPSISEVRRWLEEPALR